MISNNHASQEALTPEVIRDWADRDFGLSYDDMAHSPFSPTGFRGSHRVDDNVALAEHLMTQAEKANVRGAVTRSVHFRKQFQLAALAFVWQDADLGEAQLAEMREAVDQDDEIDRSDPMVLAATDRYRIKRGVLDEVRMMVEVSRPGRTQQVESYLWFLNLEFEHLTGPRGS